MALVRSIILGCGCSPHQVYSANRYWNILSLCLNENYVWPQRWMLVIGETKPIQSHFSISKILTCLHFGGVGSRAVFTLAGSKTPSRMGCKGRIEK